MICVSPRIFVSDDRFLIYVYISISTALVFGVFPSVRFLFAHLNRSQMLISNYTYTVGRNNNTQKKNTQKTGCPALCVFNSHLQSL